MDYALLNFLILNFYFLFMVAKQYLKGCQNKKVQIMAKVITTYEHP